jgi:hypothetical protein
VSAETKDRPSPKAPPINLDDPGASGAQAVRLLVADTSPFAEEIMMKIAMILRDAYDRPDAPPKRIDTHLALALIGAVTVFEALAVNGRKALGSRQTEDDTLFGKFRRLVDAYFGEAEKEKAKQVAEAKAGAEAGAETAAGKETQH